MPALYLHQKQNVMKIHTFELELTRKWRKRKFYRTHGAQNWLIGFASYLILLVYIFFVKEGASTDNTIAAAILFFGPLCVWLWFRREQLRDSREHKEYVYKQLRRAIEGQIMLNLHHSSLRSIKWMRCRSQRYHQYLNRYSRKVETSTQEASETELAEIPS